MVHGLRVSVELRIHLESWSIRKAITLTFTLFSCLTSRVHLLHVFLQNVILKLAPFGVGKTTHHGDEADTVTPSGWEAILQTGHRQPNNSFIDATIFIKTLQYFMKLAIWLSAILKWSFRSSRKSEFRIKPQDWIKLSWIQRQRILINFAIAISCCCFLWIKFLVHLL